MGGGDADSGAVFTRFFTRGSEIGCRGGDIEREKKNYSTKCFQLGFEVARKQVRAIAVASCKHRFFSN